MSNDNIDNQHARTLRSEALKWWALLTVEERIHYCVARYGEWRKQTSLTGREIEKIFVNDVRD